MSEELSKKPTKGYGKHSKKYWLGVYLIVAVVVYGIIFLLFIHKGSTGKGLGY